jgi:biotin synthase-related radical SAM superfamily protein
MRGNLPLLLASELVPEVADDVCVQQVQYAHYSHDVVEHKEETRCLVACELSELCCKHLQNSDKQ